MRRIKKVAILGSGVMGSGIACHFANIGIEVLLLDIAPKELTDAEIKEGLSLNHPKVKNRLVNTALDTAIKLKPAPLYKKEFAQRILTGNMDDNLKDIIHYDWIIEVVVERLDIKKLVFEKVDKFRKTGSIVSSNTSGISVEAMLDGRSDDFKKHFCGTHFFNPPRYLKLFELIPTSHTSLEVLNFLADFAKRYLGKITVVAKDTPAFVANRVGTFSIMHLFNNFSSYGLTISEIDKLTGTIIGRMKSATFRTADVVGLDTLVHVANGIKDATNDEANEAFKIPAYLEQMIANKWLGSKTNQGFFKKEESNGQKLFLSLDFATMTYKEDAKPRFSVFEKTKGIDDLSKRLRVLSADEGKAGNFYRKSFIALFKYVSHRIPEISDAIYKIDDALKAGFGWKLGPFETWDALQLPEAVKLMEADNMKPADWVYKMLSNGNTVFYKVENGKRLYYDIPSETYKPIPGTENQLTLQYLKQDGLLWQNSEASIIDLGDGVLNIEFHSKMNVIGGGTLAAINKAIDLAEEKYKAIVISNEGEHFSAGANVGMIFMFAVEQEYDELNYAVQMFQKTTTRLRHCSVPVVAAPHGMTLGGGCEVCMHADKVIAHAETYMGLVELGVGVIPGGGGTKEFILRLSDELRDNDIRTNSFTQRFMTIAQAKVSTSAYEAFDLGYLRSGVDEVIVSRELQLAYAKQQAIAMADKGYTAPQPRKDIKVLGTEAMGLVYVGAESMRTGNYISDYDKLLAEKLGYVMAGGLISQPLTTVSEKYLLDLERKAFVELCMQRKTLERMQSLIQKGQILRN